MSENAKITVDNLISVTSVPGAETFHLTVQQGDQQSDIVFPATQSGALFIAALAALPQPTFTDGQQSIPTSFSTSGLAGGRDGQGRYGLTLLVQDRAVTFILPPDQEALLRSSLAQAAPAPTDAKPN